MKKEWMYCVSINRSLWLYYILIRSVIQWFVVTVYQSFTYIYLGVIIGAGVCFYIELIWEVCYSLL